MMQIVSLNWVSRCEQDYIPWQSLFSYFLKFTETAHIPWESPQDGQSCLSTWLDLEPTKMHLLGTAVKDFLW